MRILAFAALCLAFVCSPLFAQLLHADELPLGVVKEKPTKGFFVETKHGFMVPYEGEIPGTDITYKMTPVPGGKLMMGSPADEADREESEGPQFEVIIEPYWIGVYEVTWDEYKHYMSLHDVFKGFNTHKMRPVTKDNATDAITAPSNLYDPSFTFQSGSKPKQPALSMSQYAAKQYTKFLSLSTDRFYRLPAEAEWEYACRAGTKTAYSFGDDMDDLEDYGWFYDNAEDRTQEVGQLKPNAWGVYDMHGNVAEWVLDEYSEDWYQQFKGKTVKMEDAIHWPTKLFPRVVRGGSWDFDPEACRSASRFPSHDVDWRAADPNVPKSPWWFTSGEALGVGMRLVRPLTPPEAKDREKFWKADLPEITRDVDNRIDIEGRGAVGYIDDGLPKAIEDLEVKKAEERKNN